MCPSDKIIFCILINDYDKHTPKIRRGLCNTLIRFYKQCPHDCHHAPTIEKLLDNTISCASGLIGLWLLPKSIIGSWSIIIEWNSLKIEIMATFSIKVCVLNGAFIDARVSRFILLLVLSLWRRHGSATLMKECDWLTHRPTDRPTNQQFVVQAGWVLNCNYCLWAAAD